MEARESINDSSKLVAQVISKLLNFDNLHPNYEEIEESIKMLEQALEKLTSNI